MGLAEAALDSFDWGTYEVCGGRNGEAVPDSIRLLISASDAEQALRAWMAIENVVFAQNTIYGASEPTIEVLMAALADDRPSPAREWIVEMVRFILSGGSSSDPDLINRCRHRAASGLWLLARVAYVGSNSERNAVLEVVQLIDDAWALRLCQWLGAGR